MSNAELLRDLTRAKVTFQLRTIETIIRGDSFNPARMERCSYCHCNRHVCGCDDRFDFEAVRDCPTILAR